MQKVEDGTAGKMQMTEQDGLGEGGLVLDSHINEPGS